MARVPFFGPQTRTPTATQGGQIPLSAGESGLTQIGESITDVAQVTQKFKQVERVRKLNNLTAQATKDLAEFNQSLEANPDSFENWTEQHEQWTQEYRNNIREQVDSQALFDAWDRTWTDLTTRSYVNTLTAQRKRLVDSGRADLTQNLTTYQDLYSQAEDPQARKETIGLAMLSIEEAQDAGYIDEETAVNQRQSFLEEAETTRLRFDLGANPEKTQQKFNQGEYQITPEQESRWAQKIQARVEAVQRERLRQEEAEEELIKEEKEALQEDNAVQYTISLAENGSIDVVQLREDLDQGKITRKFFDQIMGDLRTGATFFSDPMELLAVQDAIIQGSTNREEILLNSEITPQDKRQLISQFDNFEDERFKEAYQRGVEQLKAQIITTGPLANLAQGEPERLATAKNELYERLQEEGVQSLDAIVKDMTPRYDTRPDRLNALPAPRFVDKPASLADVQKARSELKEKIRRGEIDLTTPGGLSAAEREAELLEQYHNIFLRMK